MNQLIGLGNELQNNINQVGKKAYAGVAGAIAQGSIPQVTSPGETGIGVGSGYYGGQSAMAIGVSAMSDGGNWIVKGNFSSIPTVMSVSVSVRCISGKLAMTGN